MADPARAMATTSVGDALRRASRQLGEAGVAEPPLDAALLLAHLLQTDRLGLLRQSAEPMLTMELDRFDDVIARRAAGEPVSRICGRREFWSLDLRLSPAVLDPRPDSEALVEAVLSRVADRTAPWRILDLGTGSGCLLLAVLSELPCATGLGVDISAAAAGLARDNARRLGLGSRAAFVVGDWGEAVTGPFDIIVSNPPYIPSADIGGLAPEVRLHDPMLALDGGPDGLEPFGGIVDHLPRLLTGDGLFAVECGAGQADAVAQVLCRDGLEMRAVQHDLAGHERCVLGQNVARSGQKSVGKFTFRR